MIRQKKVSELPEATSIEGLVSLGVDASNKSVKIPGYLLKGPAGDKGESGVYIGSTPQETDRVWIQPQGGYEGSALTPLFVARGAVFNKSTGYYELNGLKDITEAEMCRIYQRHNALNSMQCVEAFKQYSERTNFGSSVPGLGAVMGGIDMSAMFQEAKVVTISLSQTSYISVNKMRLAFANSKNLIDIRGAIRMVPSMSDAVLAFAKCLLLENIRLSTTISISFADCANLTRDSILYIINNSANTTPITVTLHVTAFGRLTPEDIALASSKNITIATV